MSTHSWLVCQEGVRYLHGLIKGWERHWALKTPEVSCSTQSEWTNDVFSWCDILVFTEGCWCVETRKVYRNVDALRTRIHFSRVWILKIWDQQSWRSTWALQANGSQEPGFGILIFFTKERHVFTLHQLPTPQRLRPGTADQQFLQATATRLWHRWHSSRNPPVGELKLFTNQWWQQ